MRNKLPSDLINPQGRPRTPPPQGSPAPKRKMAPAEIDAQMKKAGKKDPSKPKAFAFGGPTTPPMGAQGQMFKKGGKVRGDGICTKGKTKGAMR